MSPFEKVLSPDFTNVTLCPTVTPTRLNTVLVVAADADAMIWGKIAAFMDRVAETCVLTAPDSVATAALRSVV